MSNTPEPIVDAGNAETGQEGSETRYRSIVEGSLHGIVIQQQGRIVYANRAMADLFGYTSPGDMIGLSTFDDLVVESDRSLLRARTSAIYQGHQVQPHPGWQGRRTDGHPIWVSSTGQLSDWQGRPAITSFYIDITNENLSQARQRASEAKLKLGIAVAGIGIGSMDYLANTITLDTTTASLFALPDNRPIPRADVHARFHPEDAPGILAKMAEALDPEGLGFMAIEHRIVRPDGTMRWVSARKQIEFASPHAGGQRRATTGLLALVDITDHLAAEEMTRLSELRYRRLFEAAQDGVLLLDPVSCKITDANPFMTDLLGYPNDQLIGKQLFEMGLLKDEVASRVMFESLKQTHQVRYEDLPLKDRNGRTREVEVVANLYDENGRSVIQCNIRDISERKRVEEHNKLLMFEVNHRAKNLLSVVLSVAQHTARDGIPATFVARLSERIQGLAASQDLLVKNQWRGVDLIDLVDAQLAHFKDLFGTRVKIDGPPMRLTPATAQGIGMALHELATNAGKYGALSNDSGRVRVSWQTNQRGSPLFSMSWLEDGGPAVIQPTKKGFGQTVTGRMVEAAVNGTAKIDYLESGLHWQLSAPLIDTKLG
jgi:PAS domain S-box-containing protein